MQQDKTTQNGTAQSDSVELILRTEGERYFKTLKEACEFLSWVNPKVVQVETLFDWATNESQGYLVKYIPHEHESN